MIAWLRIAGGPDGVPLNLVNPAGALPAVPPDGLTLPILAELSAIHRPLSIPGIQPAPTSNMTAALDNADGRLGATIGPRPPVRRAAQVYLDDAVIFHGVVTSIESGASTRIQLEAGMDRPLSDNLPLRTSAVWGGWKDVRVLPWGWGQVTVTPIQYSDDQRVFVLLDHAIAGVDEVRRDDVPTTAFAWANGVDSTGHPVALLELAMPLSDGERLSVTLRGRMHPGTGRLLQTPAEILHDVLANLARAPVQWPDLDDYRTETGHLVLGGILDDNTISIRAAVDEIVQSAGSAWAAAMPGIAIAWPPALDPVAPARIVTPLTADDMQARTDASGIVTVLRVLYDYDHAAARYRRAIQLRAPATAKDYGELEGEWTAPWLRSPRHAEQLGRRMLAWLARPRWRVSWRQQFDDMPTGAWVDVDHPLAPISGRHRVVDAQLDIARATLACEIEAPVGAEPEIEITRLSTAFEPLIQPGITVEIANGEIIFTARDDAGQPLAGATITLDGGARRIADSAGRVSFPATRGRHVLLVEATGYMPGEVEVVI